MKNQNSNSKKSHDAELKPCPWCGAKPFIHKYDRYISIGCDECGYSRVFKGVLQTVPNDMLVSHPDSAIKEYYHPDADEMAIDSWNRRFLPG